MAEYSITLKEMGLDVRKDNVEARKKFGVPLEKLLELFNECREDITPKCKECGKRFGDHDGLKCPDDETNAIF